jgi:hypothetical protein
MNGFRLLRHTDSSTRRLQARRRPTVEALEGRQLLSGVVGSHIGLNAADFRVGSHIGTGAMVQGGHIGTSAMVRGGHIGTSVVSDVVVMRKH